MQNIRAGGWKEELANADFLTWRGHCKIDMHVLTWSAQFTTPVIKTVKIPARIGGPAWGRTLLRAISSCCWPRDKNHYSPLGPWLMVGCPVNSPQPCLYGQHSLDPGLLKQQKRKRWSWNGDGVERTSGSGDDMKMGRYNQNALHKCIKFSKN